MAFEQKWAAVPPKFLTSDGGQFGQVIVASTSGFKVKATATLVGTNLPQLPVQIKRVLSKTQMLVGPVGKPIGVFSNVSLYTVALNSSISAEEQVKSSPTVDDIRKATYEQEPTVASRVMPVDELGKPIGESNPLPVTFDGTITVGSVEVVGTNGNVIEPNNDGSINVNVVSSPVTGHTVKNKYNEVVAVPSGSPTQIVSYTVPPATTAILQRISTSGENVARYDVYLNGVIVDTQRTMFGSDLNALFEYITGTAEGFALNSGDVLAVKVIHQRPSVGDFNARVQVLEIS